MIVPNNRHRWLKSLRDKYGSGLLPNEPFLFRTFDENGDVEEILLKITPFTEPHSSKATYFYIEFFGSAVKLMEQEATEGRIYVDPEKRGGFPKMESGKEFLKGGITDKDFFERIQTKEPLMSLFYPIEKNGEQIPRSNRNIEIVEQQIALREYLKHYGLEIKPHPLEEILPVTIRAESKSTPPTYFDYCEYQSSQPYHNKIDFRIVPSGKNFDFYPTLFFRTESEAENCIRNPSTWISEELTERISVAEYKRNPDGRSYTADFTITGLTGEELTTILKMFTERGLIANYEGYFKADVVNGLNGLKHYLLDRGVELPPNIFKRESKPPVRRGDEEEGRNILSLAEFREKMKGQNPDPPPSRPA